MAEALQRDFMDDFKRVYNENGKHDLKAQIPYLSQLADRYKKLGEKDPKERWSDILKAHTLYNSCAVRSDVKDRERWLQASFDVQKLYWGQEAKATKKDVESVAASIKVKLDTLRTELRHKLEPIGEEIETWQYSFESLESSPDAPEIPLHMCEIIQHLSAQWNDSMIDIVHSVVDEAVGICGEPPCDFSAIAFGSLAKVEATPYSDLEYLFLIEDDSPDNISYFEKLAVNSYFIVGNVQETNLKYMSIDELRQDKWFVDGAMSGLKIDGLSENAGNIPTGNNRPGTKKNRLILTPSELAKEYKDLFDNPVSDQKQPGDLTDMLTYTKEFYNHNNNNLLENFCKTIAQYLPNEKRQTASKHMLQQDIKEYDFVPNIRNMLASSYVNLKIDLYRYPSILIYDFKILHAIDNSSTWDTLRTLLAKMVISQELYDSLLFLLCAAQYIRLSAYLDRNSQEDSVSILLKNTETETAVSYQLSWHIPLGLYFRYCLTMLPVKYHIMMNLNEENGLRKPVTFNKYEAATELYKQLKQDKAVIQCIEKRFPCLNHRDIHTKFDLACAYVALDNPNCLTLFTEILDLVTINTRAPDVEAFVNRFKDLDCAISHISFTKAYALQRCGKIKQSLDLFRSVEHLSTDYNMRSQYYNSLAITHAGEDQESLAAKYFQLAEDQILLDETTDENTTTHLFNKLTQYMFMTELYARTGKPYKAEESATKAMIVSEQLLGAGYHPSKGKMHLLLGIIALKRRKNFTKAERHLSLAKKNAVISTLRTQVDIVSAELMMAQGDHKSALRSFRKLLIDNHAPETYSATDHNAIINLGLGKCYIFAGDWPAAEFYLHRARHLSMGLSTKNPLAQFKKIEINYYIAKCLFEKGKAKEALIAMGQNLEELCCLVEQTHFTPDFLHDLGSSLSSMVSMFKENDDFAGLHKLTADWCLAGMRRIAETLRLRCYTT